MKVNELINLWVGYNSTEDFAVLICACDEVQAKEIVDDYQSSMHLEGVFEIKPFDDLDTHFDCDYTLTLENNSDKETED